MLLDFYGFYPWGMQNTQYCEASYKIEMHFQNTTIFYLFFFMSRSFTNNDAN